MDFVRQINLEFCDVTLRHDGIIENRFVWDQPYEIDADQMHAIKNAMTELSEGEPKAILSIAGLFGTITTEGRKVDINPSGGYTFALALVIQELSQRLLANFYFKIKKVDYPIRTFKTEEEAVDWLKHQIQLQQRVG